MPEDEVQSMQVFLEGAKAMEPKVSKLAKGRLQVVTGSDSQSDQV